ncbi:membrane dipeptidase [Ochrobactrum vermis]|nr:membrane dipeptidase [Ochrobactrum vermis]
MIVWDSHSGFMPDADATLNNLDLWRRAGISYLSVNVGFDVMSWYDTVKTLSSFRKWFLARPEHYLLATSAEHIRDAKRQGRMAITFDIEGMNALNGRLDMIEFYHALGVRQMLFAYNRNNLAGGGCHDEPCGLTAFGRAAIDEMNRLGIFVDLSHTGYQTTMDVMAYTDKPVIFSHSNPRVLCDHERNINDDQIRACARTGGIVSIVGLNRFLGGDHASPERIADHIDYVIDLVGPRHVGIGLDYFFPDTNIPNVEIIRAAHPEYWPKSANYGSMKTEYAPPSSMIQIAEILLRRGHPEGIVRDVMGENYMRLASEIWK